MPRPKKNVTPVPDAESYRHPSADLAARPEIGAQAHFKKTKVPATYRFDSSLAPELTWDGQNPAREQGESLVHELAECGLHLADLARQPMTAERDQEINELQAKVQAAEAVLRKISGPFLNWCGKAERLSFDVPTLPMFVHERLSTKAILETLKGHKRDKQLDFLDALFGSPERSLHEQVLKAYEHRDQWVNRLVLGDSLVVMNSLLRFESLGRQVQTIYIDPPYGVKFGSNFQPFIRKRDVSHGDDDDLTREPEMVQAYRDTWELGLHSYLTYLRDRLLLARELLHPSGSIFVQISDENLHHVREVMSDVFGTENSMPTIVFRKTTGAESPSGYVEALPQTFDYIVWFAKDRLKVKFNRLFLARKFEYDPNFSWVEEPNGDRRQLAKDERPNELQPGHRLFRPNPLTSQSGGPTTQFPVKFGDRQFSPRKGGWKTNLEGMERLRVANRLMVVGNTLCFVRFGDDFPCQPIIDIWDDTRQSGFGEEKFYVVQTGTKVIQRCLLMTSDPGDLVFDPTCGSGTTAYVAEQWGRRWISCDTSRVPLALARQRLLTATFDYYELKDEKRGPAGGFVYKRRQNKKGEEVGGIVPHITLKSIANNEPPAEEVLVDRPETVKGVVRVTGPFVVEATIPAAEGLDEEPEAPGIQSAYHQTHVERMIEVLRRAPVLRLPGNQTVTLQQIRPPAKTLNLSAEAVIDAKTLTNIVDDVAEQRTLLRDKETVAILFGPENGPITERFVREAWDEAGLKRYKRLFVIGYGIDPKAREFVENAGRIGIPCVYLQATMDLQMGDLLKNMRSSQVFSVCGLPDVKVLRQKAAKASKKEKEVEAAWQVELLGLDIFDPATMEPSHLSGTEVPAWLLDTNYNGMVFRVRQAFFPRTGAWENLKKALKFEFEDTVWEHLAGTTSAPFPAGDHGQVAVKVIDPRGNELLVVKKLEERR